MLEMRDESAASLLDELNEKRKIVRIGLPTLIGALIIVAWSWPQLNDIGHGIVAVAAGLIVGAAYVADALRKTTVIMYHLEPDASESYQALTNAVLEIGRTSRLWHIDSQAQVLDRKYHAGAAQVLKRTLTRTAFGAPGFVKCNVDVANIAVGRQTLFFFPDRLLVFEAGSVGAVSYAVLTIDQGRTQFIEEEGVPSDSAVVGRTWRYVNRDGGPDRRFKDNREIPICEYETIHLASPSGLNESLYASRRGVAASLIRYLSIEAPRLEQQAHALTNGR